MTDELTMSEFATPLDLYKAKLLQAEKRIEELKQQRDELIGAFKDVKASLEMANELGGAINDTIWMMDRPETMFDFIDAAIAKVTK